MRSKKSNANNNKGAGQNRWFTTLLFRTLLNANKILVYNPVTYINPDVLKSDDPKIQIHYIIK